MLFRSGSKIAPGSKQGLFEKAVLPYLSLERYLDLPLEAFADQLTDDYLQTVPSERFDAFVVLLRSLSSPEVRPLLVEALERQVMAPSQRRSAAPKPEPAQSWS